MRIPDAIHHELLNWTRWCWMGEWPHPLPPSHCGSLESQYRAPPDWNPDDDPPPLMIRPNEAQARIVQEVYDKVLRPDERRVLKAEYPCRQKYHGRTHTAAVLGMPMWAYESILSSAVNRVEEAFAVRA